MKQSNTIIFSLAIVIAATTAACLSETQVTPVPLAPDKAAELKQALIGDWLWVAQADPGGERKPMPTQLLFDKIEWNFTFRPDGTMKFKNTEFQWSLDGANLVTTSAFKTMRVDEWGAQELKLFWYEDSKVMFWEKNVNP